MLYNKEINNNTQSNILATFSASKSSQYKKSPKGVTDLTLICSYRFISKNFNFFLFLMLEIFNIVFI